MRFNLLAVAIAASLGLAGLTHTSAAQAQSAEDFAALKAQLAALQAKVATLEAQMEAQSDVNIEQAKVNDTVTPAVDSLKKLVNDTRVSGRIFFDATNIDQSTNGNKTAASGTGFDVTRFYVAVDHKFNDTWSSNITSDAQYLSLGAGAGANQANSVEVFIKKAYVQGTFGSNFFRVGAADTPWIPFVEKAYGLRYVQNTLTDRLSYGSSSDWGVHAGGDFANGFNYAAAITNGRGYRNPARSDSVDFEARLGYAPSNSLMFAVGMYNGKRGNQTALVNPPQTAQRVDAMAAFTGAKLRAGAEWFRTDNWAVTNVAKDSASGWSGWASYMLTDTGITAFGRYDKTDTSEKLNPAFNNAYWHMGVEFPLTKGVKISAVYKDTTAKTASKTNTREIGIFGDVQF